MNDDNINDMPPAEDIFGAPDKDMPPAEDIFDMGDPGASNVRRAFSGAGESGVRADRGAGKNSLPDDFDGDYEKASYGKRAYKKVTKLRKRGGRRGMTVPKLTYSLTKPEKRRTAFFVTGIVSAVVLCAVIVMIGFFYNELIKMNSTLDGMGDFFKTMFDPNILFASFGVSAIPGILVAVFYIFIAVLLILPIVLIVYFYRFVRDIFYMSECSKEEFVRDITISDHLFALITLAVIVTAVFVTVCIFVKGAVSIVLITLIYLALIAVFGAVIAFILIERRKCKQWFDTLDEEKKRNYTEHVQALKQVKRRLKAEKDIIFRR